MGAGPRIGCSLSAGPFLGTFLGKQKGTRKREDVLISKLFVSYSLINFWSGCCPMPTNHLVSSPNALAVTAKINHCFFKFNCMQFLLVISFVLKQKK
jgi:hypothetical protein